MRPLTHNIFEPTLSLVPQLTVSPTVFGRCPSQLVAIVLFFWFSHYLPTLGISLSRFFKRCLLKFDTFKELMDQVGSVHVHHVVHMKPSPSSFWQVCSLAPCSCWCSGSEPCWHLLCCHSEVAMNSGLVARLQPETAVSLLRQLWHCTDGGLGRVFWTFLPGPGRFTSEIPGRFAARWCQTEAPPPPLFGPSALHVSEVRSSQEGWLQISSPALEENLQLNNRCYRHKSKLFSLWFWFVAHLHLCLNIGQESRLFDVY